MTESQKITLPKSKIQAKFQEFRAKKIFIDCTFTLPGQEVVQCHRLVLAENSNLFKQYFINNKINEDVKNLEIPFITDNLSFTKVINFLYENEIEIDEVNMISILATAFMLDIPSLVIMASDYVQAHIDSDFILNFTRPFLHYSVDEEKAKIYPGLKQNYQSLINGVECLSRVVASKFSRLNPISIYNSVPSYMFSQVLKLVKLTPEDIVGFDSENDFKLYMIDQFSQMRNLSIDDRIALTSTIDWSDENSYLYFVNHRLDWVPENISREKLSQVLTMRRKTIHAIEKQVSDLKASEFHHMAIYQLVQTVANSKGEEEVPNTDIIKSIGTLYGAVKQFNPELYRLVMPSVFTQPPLTPDFAASNMFIDNASYYVTQSLYFHPTPKASEEEIQASTSYRKVLTAGVDFNTSLNKRNALILAESITFKTPKPTAGFCPVLHVRYTGSNENKEIKSRGKKFVNTIDQKQIGEKPIDMFNVSLISKTDEITSFSLKIQYFEIIGKYLLEP